MKNLAATHLEIKKKKIVLLPLGKIDQDIITTIATFLETFEEFSCTINHPHAVPIGTFNKKRCQYNCKVILKYLMRCCPSECFRLMGVTDVDVYVPVLKYVFGLAQLKGNCAIVSTYRLRPEYYAEPPNQNLFYQRIYKTVLHELGHTIGITHCRNPLCVMYSSTRIDDTDRKEAKLCETCEELFYWFLEH